MASVSTGASSTASSTAPKRQSRTRPDWLPTGRSLVPAERERRHRQVVWLLWCHVVAVPVFAVAIGESLPAAAALAGTVAVFAAAAGLRLGFDARANIATLGLMTCSGILTQLSGGMIELHFHFFVMIVVVSLYQQWQPLLLAVGFVVLHHGILGAVHPSSVFIHPAGLAHPWRWALVHGFFMLAQSVACLAAWRVHESAHERARSTVDALQRVNEDLREAEELSSLGSWEWNVATGRVCWSDGLHRLFGRVRGAGPLTLQSYLEIVHPEDRPWVAATVQSISPHRSRLDYECRIVRGDGEVRTIHARGQAVFGDDGTPVRLFGTCQDITDRRDLEREVEHRALHDPLTGLVNRACFLDRLDHAIAVQGRTGAPLAVLYLDVDDFKSVNDRFGHPGGDDLLRLVAARILRAVRDSDTVARLGGDEFAVILEDTDETAAMTTAARVQAAFDEPACIGDVTLSVAASIGVSVADGSSPPSDLLRDADLAMYAAKRDGKARTRAFDGAMLSSTLLRLELQSALRDAIEHGGLRLHYQPIVDLRTGAVEAIEALVRWRHPTYGAVAPSQFVALAEESGLIVPLGEWVTREAVREAGLLRDELGCAVPVAINLSPIQFASDIVGTVETVLAESGFGATNLILEITESSLLGDADEILGKLGSLRALGVRMAIDDFGTGYSSLAYLQQLPIDILKVDRAFVQAVTEGGAALELVQVIINLARLFKLRTIGEGIETAAQAAALRALGAEAGQGYHFYRPTPMADLIRALGHANAAPDGNLPVPAVGSPAP